MKLESKLKWLKYFQFQGDRRAKNIRFIVSGIAIACGFLSLAIFPQWVANAHKSKQNEGRNYVGAMGRAQQAFYVESGHFSNDLQALGIGIPSKTVNYKYEIVGTSDEKPLIVNNLAIPIKDHQGLAYLSIVTTTVINGENSTWSRVCASQEPTGKNPIWEGLPTRGTLEDVHCECIRVGGQTMVDLSK